VGQARALGFIVIDEKDEEMGVLVTKGVGPDITDMITAVDIVGTIPRVVEAMWSDTRVNGTNVVVLGTGGIETHIVAGNEAGIATLN
jgi:hypothetical protein